MIILHRARGTILDLVLLEGRMMKQKSKGMGKREMRHSIFPASSEWYFGPCLQRETIIACN